MLASIFNRLDFTRSPHNFFDYSANAMTMSPFALYQPQGHVPDTNSFNTNFQVPRIYQEIQSVSAEPHQTASQTTTKGKKAKKPRTEWTEEQTSYLLQLWADHKDYIDSAHSQNAWKRLTEKFVKKFTVIRTTEQIKRKVNNHVDKYKVSDWNKKPSGGHTRECEFLDIIDNVLGTSDMVTFKEVESAGFTEKEDPLIVNSGASSSFQFLEREEESVEEVGDEVVEKVMTPSSHIEEQTARKTRKKKSKRDEEAERNEAIMESIVGQGDNLIEEVRGMHESSRKQTAAIERMSDNLSTLIGLFAR
eukprot:gene20826-22870_t